MPLASTAVPDGLLKVAAVPVPSANPAVVPVLEPPPASVVTTPLLAFGVAPPTRRASEDVDTADDDSTEEEEPTWSTAESPFALVGAVHLTHALAENVLDDTHVLEKVSPAATVR